MESRADQDVDGRELGDEALDRRHRLVDDPRGGQIGAKGAQRLEHIGLDVLVIGEIADQEPQRVPALEQPGAERRHLADVIVVQALAGLGPVLAEVVHQADSHDAPCALASLDRGRVGPQGEGEVRIHGVPVSVDSNARQI